MKKTVSLFLSLVMLFTLFTTATAANELAGAKSYSLGNSKSSSILEGDENDVYKFNLNNAGKINIKLSAEMKRINIKLYDNDGVELWKDTPYWNDTTELISYQTELHLCEGTYYISFSCYNGYYDEYYGNYDFEITHTAVYESFKEPQNGNNNSIKAANQIECGSDYIGYITLNDNVDIYQLTLPQSGQMTINLTANVKKLNIKLYDENANEIWKDTPYWNDTTEQISYRKNIHLCKGLYYISISNYYQGYDEYYGDYELGVYFTFSNESFSENQNGSNNKINEANLITINQRYNGLIALNDTVDFFRIDCPSMPTIGLTANMKKVNIKIYDASGKEVWKDTPYWNDTTEQINVLKETKLSAGTYFVSISNYSNYDEYYGNYSLYLTDGGYVPEAALVDSTITVKVNGNQIQFDQPPVLENGRTLVPLRAIFEALRAEVSWDGNTQTVTAVKGETQISLQIGSTRMYVNGNIKTLDVPAKLINSRTLVPVRAISEAFGCNVDWVQDTQTVVITQ